MSLWYPTRRFPPKPHASSHLAGGSDQLFDQNLNTTDEPTFAGIIIPEDKRIRSGTYGRPRYVPLPLTTAYCLPTPDVKEFVLENPSLDVLSAGMRVRYNSEGTYHILFPSRLNLFVLPDYPSFIGSFEYEFYIEDISGTVNIYLELVEFDMGVFWDTLIDSFDSVERIAGTIDVNQPQLPLIGYRIEVPSGGYVQILFYEPRIGGYEEI